MPAMVETMGLDVSDGPSWHGEENPFNGLKKAEEVADYSRLKWLVEQMKIPHPGAYVPHPTIPDAFVLNAAVPQFVPGFVANVRSTDSTVLGFVTEMYKPVQNWEAFEFVDNIIGNHDAKYNSAGCLFNKYGRPTRIWISAELTPTKVLGDDFRNYLVFYHSHDGDNAIRTFITTTRVVCHNTLNMALENAQRMWSTRHIGNIHDKLQAAQETLKLYDKYITSYPSYAKKLSKFNLYDEEVEAILLALFPDDGTDGTGKETRVSKNANIMRAGIRASYNESPVSKKFYGSAWGLLQGITDVIQHIDPFRKTPKTAINREFMMVDGHPVVNRAQKIIDAMIADQVDDAEPGEK